VSAPLVDIRKRGNPRPYLPRKNTKEDVMGSIFEFLFGVGIIYSGRNGRRGPLHVGGRGCAVGEAGRENNQEKGILFG
jgi:hypothetical protein